MAGSQDTAFLSLGFLIYKMGQAESTISDPKGAGRVRNDVFWSFWDPQQGNPNENPGFQGEFFSCLLMET